MFFRSLLGIIFKRHKFIMADCGHLTAVVDIVEAFGERVETRLPLKKGKTPYCHRCLEKMVIRCAWCGKAIFIGDPITLYTPIEDFKIPDYAVIYNKDPLQLVGCLRWDCAEGVDRAGFWYPPGKVFRVESPLERAMRTGDVVIVSDLSDFNEAIN